MCGSGKRSLRQNPQSSPDRLNKHSLSRIIEGFLLKCKLEDLTPETIETHRLQLGRFVDYCGDCSISDVSPVNIREFLGYVEDYYGLDIIIIQRHLVSVKAFFNWVFGEGFIIYNPTIGVRVSGILKKVVRGLSEQELKQLLMAVQGSSSVLEVRNKAILPGSGF